MVLCVGDRGELGGEVGWWCDSTVTSELWWVGERDVAQSNLLKNRFNLLAQSWSLDSGTLPGLSRPQASPDLSDIVPCEALL